MKIAKQWTRELPARATAATRPHLPLATALALLTLFAGCESFGKDPAAKDFTTECQKSTGVSNAAGKKHGEPCTNGSECMYGICKYGALQLIGDGTQGVCTKDCSCGAGSQCSDDNAGTQSYTCIFSDAKPVTKECAATCTSDADCAKVNPALPFCTMDYDGVFSTGVKVCVAKKAP